jgi:hypothetical protein
MRLADFILANIEPILVDWVSFARTITPEKNIAVLRDHAADILRATARDMIALQTDEQRSDKSKGDGEEGKASQALDTASADHAVDRVDLGFDMIQLLSEYRSLRASVVRLWRESLQDPVSHDLDDLTRFNEAIDQSVAEAVHSYTDRVDESREMFLAILGHDLRNPLAAMKLTGYVLGQNQGLDAASLKMVQEIANTTEQMERMILDLLDYAVTRMGQSIPIVTAEMNLETLCRNSVAEMQAAHPLRTIRFTPHGDLYGAWDSRRLWQVLSNLLGNAMQHGAQHTPVDLSVTGEASEVVINVHSEGNPISPDRLPSLFHPMSHRPDPGTALRPGSVGLGLYIVREIVTAHAGSVHVQSSHEAGTDFTVRLPRQPPANEPQAVPSRH